MMLLSSIVGAPGLVPRMSLSGAACSDCTFWPMIESYFKGFAAKTEKAKLDFIELIKSTITIIATQVIRIYVPLKVELSIIKFTRKAGHLWVDLLAFVGNDNASRGLRFRLGGSGGKQDGKKNDGSAHGESSFCGVCEQCSMIAAWSKA